MTALDASADVLDQRRRDISAAARYYGVYPAKVVDNQDPDGQGRVQVELPWAPDSGGGRYALWARLATMMAGNNRGTWFVPESGDEVLVCFQGGDPRWPYVIGALWNGSDAAPETIDSDNDVKAIVSRAGIRITLDDTSGSVTLRLETPNGQKLTLADAGNTITMEDASGNSIELAPDGITIDSASELTISAASSATIDVPTVNVTSAMWTYSGVIQCDTIIANAVVGASYTPGAGNIW